MKLLASRLLPWFIPPQPSCVKVQHWPLVHESVPAHALPHHRARIENRIPALPAVTNLAESYCMILIGILKRSYIRAPARLGESAIVAHGDSTRRPCGNLLSGRAAAAHPEAVGAFSLSSLGGRRGLGRGG